VSNNHRCDRLDSSADRHAQGIGGSGGSFL